MRSRLLASWYRPTKNGLAWALWPLSVLFGLIARLRRALYRFAIFKSYHVNVPVIVIGNIAVGGTGKTPLVMWLAQFLQQHGYKPGIVSRGVGAKQARRPIRVTPHMSSVDAGDEPLLIAQKTGCHVVICRDRVAAVKTLLANHACNVVISDDGLQHYRLHRDIEIAVIDGKRQHGNQCLLPAGPLREPVSRLDTVDFLIVHSHSEQAGYHFYLSPDKVVPLTDASQASTLADFAGKTVHAVAGIGHPERFFSILTEHGLNVIPHSFPDHHAFCADDFVTMQQHPILMTEKDAIKCMPFADSRFLYLSTITCVSQAFQDALLLALKTKEISDDSENDFTRHSCRGCQ